MSARPHGATALCTKRIGEDRHRKSREGWGINERLWPLEAPRPNVSAERTAVFQKCRRFASRGASSRQCLSCGVGEALPGSSPSPEPPDRPEASSPSPQASPSDEPIKKLPPRLFWCRSGGCRVSPYASSPSQCPVTVFCQSVNPNTNKLPRTIPATARQDARMSVEPCPGGPIGRCSLW